MNRMAEFKYRSRYKWVYFWGGVVIGNAPLMYLKHGWIGLIPAIVNCAIILTVYSAEKKWRSHGA